MCARLPSVSAFLHELAALGPRTEIAWGFEEAQRGVRETLPGVSLFLREVIKGALSWSCFPRNIPKRSDASDTMPVLRRKLSAACAALDHVAKKAMFSRDTELDRWSLFGFFYAKFLSFSELPFELGSLAFKVSD